MLLSAGSAEGAAKTANFGGINCTVLIDWESGFQSVAAATIVVDPAVYVELKVPTA